MIKDNEVLKSKPHLFVIEVLGKTAEGLLKLELFNMNENKRFYAVCPDNIVGMTVEEKRIMELKDKIYTSYIKQLETKERKGKEKLISLSEKLISTILPTNRRYCYMVNDCSFNIHGYTISFEYINYRLTKIHAQRLKTMTETNLLRYFKEDVNGVHCFDFSKSITRNLLKKYEAKNDRLNSFKNLRKHGELIETSTLVNSKGSASYLHNIVLKFDEPLCILNDDPNIMIAKEVLNKIVKNLSNYNKQ